MGAPQRRPIRHCENIRIAAASRSIQPKETMPSIHSIALAFTLLLGVPATQEPRTPSRKPPATPRSSSAHSTFDSILKATVKDGLIDYTRIRKEFLRQLETYLESLAKVDVPKLPRPEQFATYINLYNATMIRAVLERTDGNADWTPEAADFAVFKEPVVHLITGHVTLNDLENKILRAGFKDMRVHVALVCGARSCPPLLSRAYEADDLESILDSNLRAFLHDTTRNQVDAENKTVRLSKLFEWYAEDFGGEAGVRKLLASHLGAAVGTYRIEYLDYSWNLNAQADRRGK